MPRVYTRAKRKLGLTTSKFRNKKNTVKKKGAKTFPKEDKAKDYAVNVLKLKEEKFKIVPAKKNKRFKVVKN